MSRRLPGKPWLFALCLAPLLWFAWRQYAGALGPDPGKEIVLFTGTWGLNLLLLTLAVSPARTWLRQPRLLRYRRMLGLFCFFYASLHALSVGTYIVGWQWGILTEELRERPYMLAGFAAWLTLLPLALTSNRYAVRKLGLGQPAPAGLSNGGAGADSLALAHSFQLSGSRALFPGSLVPAVLAPAKPLSPELSPLCLK